MSVLDRLPLLLNHLADVPSPAQVVRALERGTFEAAGMRAGMLWSLAGDGRLVLLAARGHTPEEEARHSVVPVEPDSPMGLAVRENRVDVRRSPDFGGLYLTDLDEPMWREIEGRHRMVAVVTVPARLAGSPVGALRLVLDRPWAGDRDEVVLVEAVADALGLWMTHPESGCADVRPPASVRAWSLSFTERQREVLRLAGDGLTNRQIAAALWVSEWTVKQDLRLAMGALRVSDRALAAARARELGLR